MKGTVKLLFLVFGILFSVSAAQAATYYVSPTGNNANPGTISQPFATLQKAHDVANPGDTIYMRGGTYPIPVQTVITRNGSSGNHIKVFNYPGEVPILDGASNPNTGGHSVIKLSSVSWWHIKGLEIKNSPGFGIGLTGTANNIIIENNNVHDNVRLDTSGAGIELGASGPGNTVNNILVLNNDSHHNGKIGTSGGSGIGVSYSQQTGNILRGNRLWRNNDNGLHTWDSANLLIENNWVWETGYNDHLAPEGTPSGGDGVGYKLGGGGAGDGNNIVRNNLAWRNLNSGFDDNAASIPLIIYNNTAWENNRGSVGGSNFAFYSPVANVLKNNLALTPNTVSFSAAVQHTFNSWNGATGVTVSAADFVTLDFTANLGARQADGSLPVSNFLRLVAGSDLIDKGVNVGIAYTGSVPDLGAYEYVNPAVALEPPTDVVVK
jgi:hypothetical protein